MHTTGLRYATLMLKAEIYMWAAKVSITGFTANRGNRFTDCQDCLIRDHRTF